MTGPGQWTPGDAPGRAPDSRPNLVFILADGLGWSATSLYGSAFYETPHRLSRRLRHAPLVRRLHRQCRGWPDATLLFACPGVADMAQRRGRPDSPPPYPPRR